MITRVFLNIDGMGSKMCLMSTRSYGRGLDRWNARYSFNDRPTIDRTGKKWEENAEWDALFDTASHTHRRGLVHDLPSSRDTVSNST